jgi:hypothetical protein
MADNINMTLAHTQFRGKTKLSGCILLCPIFFLQGDHVPRPALAR